MKELVMRLRKEAQDQREEAEFHAESSVRALRHRLNEIACGRDLQWEWAPRFSSATRAANLALDLEAAADALERLSACPHCNGDGWIVKMGKGRMDCPQCDGTGKSEVMRHDP